MISMVPTNAGPQRYEAPAGVFDVKGAFFVAHAGTGFDIDDPVHQTGSDGIRWAIAIQQARDEKRYAEADQMSEFASKFFRVEKRPDRTILHVPNLRWEF